MDIKTATIPELKAFCYDCVKESSRLQALINAVEAELQTRNEKKDTKVEEK